MIKIRVKLTMVLCDLLLEASAYGAYRDPIAKTNINPKTDLFEKGIEDYGTFQDHMGSLKEQAIDGITSSGNIELITDKTGDEIKSAASDLSTIRATDLQVKGQEEVLRTGMTGLHVDYTDPLIAGHKKDASRIADASGDLLKKLTELFKEFGIDCRTVKGNKVTQPEYYIDVKKEQVKDTVYTRTMCEEPRNRYNCHDSLIVRCIKRGMKWGAWQDKTIIIPYQSIPWHWWIRSYFRPTDTRVANSFNRFTINPVYHQEIAIYIASAIGVSLSQINVGTQDIVVTHIWDALYPGYSQNVVSNTLRGGGIPSGLSILNGLSVKASKVTFYYQYRSGSEICAEWVDEWDEVCGLES
ncbi:hypothetical protein N3Z16_04345 [Candidatus Megaera polyxenophila]|uniref:hypothetical protein n=1 Tax=Candidatus Megaera polyxenophila TaxID=988779 RepID=UPI00249E3B8F|nr:hypothetical protein N3Z16_04345 [Candidatus Megaera polyxenophila]